MIAPPIIQIFTKYPTPGQVKTRLAQDTGDLLAADVHRELVWRQLTELVRLPQFYRLELWGNVDADAEFYRTVVQRWPRLRYRRQCEGDLGIRLRHALARSMQHAPCVLQIGTDCPVLQIEDICLAVQAAQQQADVVFIPAEDGGYVLAAYSGYHQAMFDNIEWSTEKVLAQAIQQLWRLGFTTTCLPTLWDLDRLEDLERYRKMFGSCASKE